MSTTRLSTTRFQADHHWLYRTERFVFLKDYVLHLQHVKAYEFATEMLRGPVLDIGCNVGYGTALLREYTDQPVVGVDVSERAIQEAKVRYGGDFQIVDGKRLPFGDGEFGTVLSLQVIEHINDLEPYLSEIRRVLRPGGVALLTTPNAATRLDAGQRPWNRFHVREFTADELYRTVEPYFSNVRILGLFGTPELEAIEQARVARLRAAGHIRSRISRFLPLRFENWLVLALKSLRRMGKPPLGDDQMAAFTTAHLWYTDEERVDQSLALLAVCTR